MDEPEPLPWWWRVITSAAMAGLILLSMFAAFGAGKMFLAEIDRAGRNLQP